MIHKFIIELTDDCKEYSEEVKRLEREYGIEPIEEHDAKVRAKGESIGITRVLDILEQSDKQMLQKVKDALYEQDYIELKEQKE